MTRSLFATAGLSVAAVSLAVLSAGGPVRAAAAPSAGQQSPLARSAAAIRLRVPPDVTRPVRSGVAAPSATTAPPPAPPPRQRYQVRPGDSLWSIAERFHVGWYNLAADNGMQMYSVMHPGTVLVLPRAGEPPHAPMPLAPPVAPGSATVAAAEPIGGGSFEQCVISRESGGDPDASNGSHWGLFQFTASTWAAYGGDPAAYGTASASQQQEVFSTAVADGGESNWAPYDGC